MSTFAELSRRSVSTLKVLVEIDIRQLNEQWVNAGAGVWKCSFDNSYPEVDASLLDGFTAQTVARDIGSVLCDSGFLQSVDSVLEVSENQASYFYDRTNKIIYVAMPEWDDPHCYTVYLGLIYGYARDEYVPGSAFQIYEGRLVNDFSIGYSRDPLFFGKVAYQGVTITLANNDGEFDDFCASNDVYGNAVRVKLGFDSLEYTDYATIYTGYIENVDVTEDEMSIGVIDVRKQLSKSVVYSCTAKNAMDAILELLQAQSPGLKYSDAFFDTTAWDAATAVADDVSLFGDADNPVRVMELIELICSSIFGLFVVDADNKFSFRMLYDGSTASATIPTYDILSRYAISYDPSQVITSTRLEHPDTGGTAVTVIDTSQEEDAYLKYRVYNQHSLTTCLSTATAASALSTTILDYFKDVHAQFTVVVPLAYYTVAVGDVVDLSVERENGREILGTVRCEVLGKSYDLGVGTITLALRVFGSLTVRVTTDGSTRATTDTPRTTRATL